LIFTKFEQHTLVTESCILTIFYFPKFNIKLCKDGIHYRLNAAFTLNGFDDQERDLTFVKTDFQVSKLKFHACNFKAGFLISS